jgi:hypothetical protein
VHRGPQRAICESIVVLPTIKWRQIHNRVLHLPFLYDAGLGIRLRSDLPAPPKPETLVRAQDLAQCNG